MNTPSMMSACNRAFWVLVAFASAASAQTVSQLIPHQVKLESVDYLGKRAVKITEAGQVANGEAYAIVRDAVFHNGAIDVELAGRPVAGAAGDARGFIGVAFRLQNGQFEYVYLRPTNGRADDQVRLNHSTLYSAHPNFSFASPANRHRKSMRVTWTLSRASGRATASLSRGRRLPAHAATAVALWVLHAHVFAAWFVTPIVAITSPVKRCGKSNLLIVLDALIPRSLMASNVTPAVIYRAIEAFGPSLLIDEADTFLPDNRELRGVLNSGHTRRTAYVLRCDGDSHDPRRFSTWCPKAIALIG